jgi:hypothetical protein
MWTSRSIPTNTSRNPPANHNHNRRGRRCTVVVLSVDFPSLPILRFQMRRLAITAERHTSAAERSAVACTALFGIVVFTMVFGAWMIDVVEHVTNQIPLHCVHVTL